MKRVFLFLLIIAFSSSIYAQPEMAEDAPKFAPGEFLFTFKEGTVKTFKKLKVDLQEEIAVTGVPLIDKLNKQFKVKSIEPIFPKAYYKSYGFPEIYAGVANSLKAKLNNAKAKINAGDTKAAINILNAFINAVSAQKGKHIDSDAADSLISDANSIIESLESSSKALSFKMEETKVLQNYPNPFNPET